MGNKSILFVGRSLDYGGAGKMMKYVANLCTSCFDCVSVLTIYERHRSKDLSTLIYHCSLEDDDQGGLMWRVSLIKRLRQKIREINPVVVCTFVSDLCVTTRIATLGMKMIVVSAERGDPFSSPIKWRLMTKWTYLNSDYCFFQLDKARDYFGDKVARKSFVIPNAYVCKSILSPYSGQRRKTIVGAGRFVKEKRFEVLIEAFSIVHKLHSEYKLILYGKGEYLVKYQTIARQLNVSEFVSFPGYVDSVSDTIREDGIFVLPSLYEGIPNVLIEALSVGIPCVSTNCTPGGPDLLTKGGTTGLLVPVDDVDAMADAILRIIDDNDLAKELSLKGPAIINDLKKDKIDALWLDAFKKITER